MEKNKPFNIVIAGAGGQGLITLTMIIAEAALIENLDVKTSETHGLSQRGGSVETHIRFGKKIYSPLVSLAKADLVLGLEMLEALRVFHYANSKTIFLVNRAERNIIKKFKKIVKGPKYIIPSAEICKKQLGKEVLSGIYLLSYAVHNKLIPLKPKSILKAIVSLAPKKYLDLNKKVYKLASKHAD